MGYTICRIMSEVCLLTTLKKERQADPSPVKKPLDGNLVIDNYDYPLRKRQSGKTVRSYLARVAGAQAAPRGLGLTSSQALTYCLSGEYR